MMNVPIRKICQGLAWVSLVAPLGAQAPSHSKQPSLEVNAIAGVFGRSAQEEGGQPFSGLFLASAKADGVYFHSSASPGWEPEDLVLYYPYGAPGTMTFGGEDLLLCAPGGTALWRIPLMLGRRNEPGLTTIRQEIPLPFREGSCRLAASRTGVLAVTGPGPGFGPGVDTVWLSRDPEAGWQPLSVAFEGLIDVEFSDWNRFHVLDGTSISTFVVFKARDGSLDARSVERLRFSPENGSVSDLRAMGVYNGIVYVADPETVYAFLQGLDRLIPVSGSYRGHGDIRDLTASYTDLYVLDQGRVHNFPRTSPVQVTLKASLDEAQSALLDLFAYLTDRNLLAKRVLVTKRAYPSLASLLHEQHVMLATPEDFAKRDRSFSEGLARLFGGKKQSLEDALAPTICSLNPQLCPSGRLPLEIEVPADFKLVLPDLLVRSHLETTEVALVVRETLGELLTSQVFDPELLERAKSVSALRRLNPRLEKVRDEDLLQVDRGMVTVPKEYWTVTLPALAKDFKESGSPLRELERRYGGLTLFSYETFPGGGATWGPLPTDPLERQRCQTLREAHQEVLRQIHFVPEEQRPIDTRAQVSVGVVDLAGTLRKEHEIFNADPDWRTWHSVNLFDLEADPVAASVAGDVASGLDVFSKGTHHATHVAALIGGRETACWSGLLPHAKMVFIPSGPQAEMAELIRDAKSALVSTFNVSLDMERSTNSGLRTVIDDFTENVLFVVAAGNARPGERGRDLNHDAVPEQASWTADFGNVISVTASDANGDLLNSANYGKDYVDLVAPGENLLSATEPDAFGRASGTSQATPLVTAAAAVLMDRQAGYRFAPGDVKARLIATALWDDELRDKVWGGRLDFSAALRFPKEDVLVTGTPPYSSIRRFTATTRAKIVLATSPRNYERAGAEFSDERYKRFPFESVLSMQKQGNGKYRIVLKDPRRDRLVILLDAQFPANARIPCAELKVWDKDQAEFLPTDEAECAHGIPIDSVHQYVRGAPYLIKWRRE